MSKLAVDNLVTHFHTDEGVVKAVDGVSFDIQEGETLGLVGESGSGKSVTARSILRLINPPGRIKGGHINFNNQDLLDLPEEEMEQTRGQNISMIFQDPMSGLNPVLTVGEQIARVIERHRLSSYKNLYSKYVSRKTKGKAREEAISLMEKVGIPEAETRVDDYPHEFSGGMRQRVMIAMAISCNPDVLIADEPTTALDVTIEAQIFNLLNDLKDELGMSILLITHDLGVVADTCDRVAVMYAGRIVETGTVKNVFKNPQHPYTIGLLESIPRIGDDTDRLMPIEGNVPTLIDLPQGCTYADRCPKETPECHEVDPSLRETHADREVACIHSDGWGEINE
jgi:oligopeptide/dipeptide ABC transporter ATP-binding protein